jgi:hypothetical protein
MVTNGFRPSSFNAPRVATASASKHLIVHGSIKMAPDTSLEPFVNVSAAAMSLPTIPTSPDTLRDTNLDEDSVDPEAKLILSDFTQSSSVLNSGG